jgi:arsenate reductase
MAEGWLRSLAGNSFLPQSAGGQPKPLNPVAVQVMREAGVDISSQSPKSVASLLGGFYPIVINVCERSEDRCPIFPGVCHREEWGIPDPDRVHDSEEERLAVFRSTRERIRERVERLIEQYNPRLGAT